MQCLATRGFPYFSAMNDAILLYTTVVVAPIPSVVAKTSGEKSGLAHAQSLLVISYIMIPAFILFLSMVADQ